MTELTAHEARGYGEDGEDGGSEHLVVELKQHKKVLCPPGADIPPVRLSVPTALAVVAALPLTLLSSGVSRGLRTAGRVQEGGNVGYGFGVWILLVGCW